MHGTPAPPGASADVFTIGEVARAAGVAVRYVRSWAAASNRPIVRGFLRQADAVSLVRELRSVPALATGRTRGLGIRGSRVISLAASGLMHGLLLVGLTALAALHLLSPATAMTPTPRPQPVRLVLLVEPGPGGGGGGGGLRAPAPPAPARTEDAITRRTPPAAPPVARIDPTPQSVVVPRADRPTQIVPLAKIVANVQPRQTPPIDRPHTRSIGLIAPVANPPPSPAPSAAPPGAAAAAADQSPGPGAGGGTGTGSGFGAGDGRGDGAGPGTGGGTGGGAFQPGTGVTAPTLLREVKPDYTDEARRRALEGDVDLEIVIRSDGTVGAIRLTRGLGAGLDQKAIDAVRQWRFAPAQRRGAPVEVVVDVSVGFKLR